MAGESGAATTVRDVPTLHPLAPPAPFSALSYTTLPIDPEHPHTHTRPGTDRLTPTDGRWLLQIQIPPSYPLEAPQVTFATPIIHPNVSFTSGEICLDLFKDAWSPAYSVLEVVRAVRMLLSCPETDSPLNVDFAALMRGGDLVGCRALVELWCRGEGRYEGY